MKSSAERLAPDGQSCLEAEADPTWIARGGAASSLSVHAQTDERSRRRSGLVDVASGRFRGLADGRSVDIEGPADQDVREETMHALLYWLVDQLRAAGG